MSILSIHTVECDVKGPHCRHWISEAPTRTEARREARDAGWQRIEGKDVCPGCRDEVATDD